MRVISGTNKGLRLKAVAGRGTRPTSDKVKEALFNIIGPYFEGGTMLDLYAGSGGVSVEALSRGMDHAVLVEQERQAVRTIHENLQSTGLAHVCEVYRTDAKQALKAAAKQKRTFRLIFMDPPYKKGEIVKLLGFIDAENLLEAGGQIVCEHEASLNLPETAGHLARCRTERYGDTAITLFTQDGGDEFAKNSGRSGEF